MSEQTTAKNKQLLYIAYISYIFFPIIGVIIAYIKRQELKNTTLGDHCTFIIRTFWIGVVFVIISIITSMLSAASLMAGAAYGSVGAGFGFSAFLGLLSMVVAVLYLVRIIAGFIKLHGDKTINAKAWIIP